MLLAGLLTAGVSLALAPVGLLVAGPVAGLVFVATVFLTGAVTRADLTRLRALTRRPPAGIR